MKVLKIKNEDYKLKYTMNSLVIMEQESGRSFMEVLGGGNLTFADLRRLAYYGFFAEHPDMAIEEAGDILDGLIAQGKNLTEVTNIFMEELSKALGAKEDKNPNA